MFFVANEKITNKGITVGYQIAGINESTGEVKIQNVKTADIKIWITERQMPVLNLSVDRAGRLVRSVLREDDIRRLFTVNNTNITGSVYEQEGVVKYAHRNKNKAIEAVTNHYKNIWDNEDPRYFDVNVLQMEKEDLKDMIAIIKTGDVKRYWNMSTSPRERFCTIIENLILNKQ